MEIAYAILSILNLLQRGGLAAAIYYSLGESCKVKKANPHSSLTYVFKVDPFHLSRLLGDLAHAAKKLRHQDLLEEFGALCDVLENAENHDIRLRGLSLDCLPHRL